MGVVAGFAVQADAISEISFLSSLGLTDVAVVYVSEKIPISPYEFINPSFKRYISSSDDPDTPEFQGVTIYARFVPGPDNMLGHILREGMSKLMSVTFRKTFREINCKLELSPLEGSSY